PEGRRGRERKQMRQKVSRLTEKIDPEIVVLDADMNVHAANDESPPDLLEVAGDHVLAFLVGVLLARPCGEGVGRCGEGSEAELAGDAADRAAKKRELVARLLHRTADARADLDLRAQELGADLAAQRLLALRHQLGRRLLGEVARAL